jgi:dihydroxyacetone kinase
LFCLQGRAANGKVGVVAGGGGGHEPFAAGKLQKRLAREKQLFVHDYLSRFA